MKRRTILIIPPRGVPLKAFRIRLSVAIIFFVIVVIGVAGFFIPINTLTNDVVEQNQRKNLTEQNKALLQKIITTLRMLKNLKAQVGRLEEKKMEVVEVSGNAAPAEDEPVQRIEFSKLKTEELLPYLNNVEKRFGVFRDINPDSTINMFDTVPVLRPIPAPYLISRRFGPAVDPFSGRKKLHNGTDFVAEKETPVVATAAGVVKRIEKHEVWGNKVVIEHGKVFTTVYAHLGKVRTSRGKQVKRGEIIGEIGMSGLSSGPHVHYEIWKNKQVVNPEEYLFPIELFASRN
jgi:murein DD-endopeptidase MepM/ murein hydrolase activator NlpD